MSSSSSAGTPKAKDTEDFPACRSTAAAAAAVKTCNLRPKIAILPKAVVDQIAAGEVVQRPVSVVKELLENSLDAGATQIVVRFDGLSHLSITDNGKGIAKKDLELLCTRHATSKLQSVDDFSTLGTFGFRGEALASTSMVSRLLTVVSRVRLGDYDDDDDDDKTGNNNNNNNNNNNTAVAYSQTYKSGKPIQANPRPCARKVGTTITIQDLFYNVPHRQKAYSKKESEEYAKIHKVIQDYSVHYPHVGFVCQRKTKKQLLVDCNTGQIPAVKALMEANQRTTEQTQEATKQILSQILESNLAKHLMYMECQSGNDNDNNQDRYKFRYTCQLYFTTPFYQSENRRTKQGKFVLFLNHRLVDLPPLKRALEEVYLDLGNSQGSSSNNNNNKPVLVINLQVPGCQVDVNVHPSKRQVALMHQEDLIGNVTAKFKERLEEDGQTFVAQSVKAKPIRNPYAAKKRKREETSNEDNNNNNEIDNNKIDIKYDDDENDSKETPSKKPQHSASALQQTRIQQTPDTKIIRQSTNSSSSSKKVAPSKLIRTNSAARAGAIEPFLVPTQTQTQQTQQLSQNSETSEESNPPQGLSALASSAILHVPTCPLSKTVPQIDMTKPGAFADQLRLMRCTCPTEAARRTVLIPKPKTRPQKVVPTPSKYTSIATLRKRIGKQQCFETTQHIRTAFFMGTLSHQRSLIQCDEHLMQINHCELAKELFYQLALARFGGGAQLARFGDPIHIQTVVAQALQCEDELALQHEKERESMGDNSNTTSSTKNTTTIDNTALNHTTMLEVNDSNRNLAQHVTARLVESAPMLDEYFSIRIESQNSESNSIDDISSGALLTGLPVLLEGHCPQPHALPIFLLRLATQVDWTREKHCFHQICKELGNFYAMLPPEEELNAYVQHHLFPALSYLMLPSKNLTKNGHFAKLTKLSTLYKVFERC